MNSKTCKTLVSRILLVLFLITLLPSYSIAVNNNNFTVTFAAENYPEEETPFQYWYIPYSNESFWNQEQVWLSAGSDPVAYQSNPVEFGNVVWFGCSSELEDWQSACVGLEIKVDGHVFKAGEIEIDEDEETMRYTYSDAGEPRYLVVDEAKMEAEDFYDYFADIGMIEYAFSDELRFMLLDDYSVIIQATSCESFGSITITAIFDEAETEPDGDDTFTVAFTAENYPEEETPLQYWYIPYSNDSYWNQETVWLNSGDDPVAYQSNPMEFGNVVWFGCSSELEDWQSACVGLEIKVDGHVFKAGVIEIDEDEETMRYTYSDAGEPRYLVVDEAKMEAEDFYDYFADIGMIEYAFSDELRFMLLDDYSVIIQATSCESFDSITITAIFSESGGNPSEGEDPPVQDVPVASVSFTPGTANVMVGKSITLEPAILPEDATDKSLTWSSDNSGIATVENGAVTGISTGSATISATAKNGTVGTCVVSVIAADTPTGDNTFTVTYATEGYTGGEVYQVMPFLMEGFRPDEENKDEVAPGETRSYSPTEERDPYYGFPIAFSIVNNSALDDTFLGFRMEVDGEEFRTTGGEMHEELDALVRYTYSEEGETHFINYAKDCEDWDREAAWTEYVFSDELSFIAYNGGSTILVCASSCEAYESITITAVFDEWFQILF